ncbi:esterase/lipase family protein [methane-oxidizing endosymbiont of Gigantopelta aegis]|uniref:esterase/lipase family protein n=1 Tax=methane-oxidizing endosymbiont of Gigantopelta aegis TaxID=2794938 RepID=UPI002479AC17|nr:alpha/beta hydrolase [methane-oxidizing endosymbiont of Gigantopelta aegis]
MLLHGLARSHRSMAKLEKALTKQGYSTINMDYPSTKYPIEELAENTIPKALACCHNSAKVHFVTHSLGGILARHYLANHTIENLGRVVMLGPPNKGSNIVNKLHQLAVYQFINGPAGMQIGAEESSLPNQLGAVNFELGVIAGTRTVNPVLSLMLEKPNDGKVSVENSKVDGMTEHITLPVTHTFMMNNNSVISYVIHFLKYGTFKGMKNLRNPFGVNKNH